MKIAFVYPFPLAIGKNIPKLPGNFGVGGGEVYSFRVAMKLAEHGHDVTFFTGLFPGIKKNPLAMGRLQVKYLPIHIWRGFTQYAMMKNLFPKLLRGKFDIIHSWQFPTAYTFIGGVAAKLTGAKFFVSHVGITPGTSRSTKMFSKMNKPLVDEVIVLTDYGKTYYKNYVSAKRLKVIYPGIDTSMYYRAKKKKIEARFRKKKMILYSGRLIPSKGIDYLIKAFAIISKKHSEARLVIIGQGHVRSDLEKLANDLGVSVRVLFTGYVSDVELRGYYSRSDVFVLPPVYKDSWGGKNSEPGGFGLVLAEAMACGSPTVATNVDAIPDWIKDGHNGLLCKPNDENCLARKIELLFSDSTLRKKIIENARKIVVEKYTLDKVAEQLEKLYKESKL